MLKIYQLRKKQNTFEVTLKYKGVGVRVLFENGNNYNNIPAKCYTNDPFKQRAIENSEMFRNKEIVLERQVEEAGDRKAAVRTAVRRKPASKPAPVKPAPAKPVKPAHEIPADPEPEPEPVKDAEESTGEAGPEKMEFDNLGEAILYIVQNYQVEVQTEKEAREVLKAHGIKPVIKKG